MSTASLNRVKVALLRELELTFQSRFHQHLSEVITDLRVHNIERSGEAKSDEALSVIQSSGILQLMSGPELGPLRSALERLRTGDFGICLRCGRKIALHELEHRPTKQMCSRCQPAAKAPRVRAHPRTAHR